MSKESKARYEHYRSIIYKETMESVHNYRAKMYYGKPLHEVPSILDATIASDRASKKEAKAMVKADKRIARLNKVKLKDLPLTKLVPDIENHAKAG